MTYAKRCDVSTLSSITLPPPPSLNPCSHLIICDYVAPLTTLYNANSLNIIQGGVEADFSKLTSREDVIDQFGQRRREQLLRFWDRTHPRCVEVTLVKAENIASLDANGFSDPHYILALGIAKGKRADGSPGF